jgi:lipoprotein signal peptidase
MAERTYRWLFWVLAVGGTVLDQVSKYTVFRWLYNGGEGGWWPAGRQVFWVQANFRLEDYLRGKRDPGGWLAPLRTWSGEVPHCLNHGALFGLGDGHNTLFCVISVFAAVAIVYWVTRRAAARDWLLCAALGLILAGTLGNLYDRAVFGGVRDFLHFNIEGVIDWPIFNLADSCLVCGAGLLLLQAFWTRTPATGTDGADAARAPAMAGGRK